MDAETLPKKQADTPVRRPRLIPGPITLGILGLLLAAVLFVRFANQSVEAGGLDEAAGNLGTIFATVIAAITLWAWFSFRSTYPTPYRVAGCMAGLVLGVFLFSSVRLVGITGNWVPTGVRWAWQQPRDFTRAKPVVAVAESAEDTDADSEPRPIEPTPDDFPQFLGPGRNGVLPDVQLSHDWEATPPKLLWKKEVGAGWSGFSVVADRAVTLEQYGDEEVITCRQLDTGDVLWTRAIPGRHQEFMGGIGPRSTPTIHESKVYTLGATGVLSCLHLSNGALVWQHNLRERYETTAEEDLKAVMWGRANSPLIHGEFCIVPAGGKEPVALVAFDKQTGDMRWESVVDWKGKRTQISYASPTLITLAGKEQIVSVNEKNVSGHDPQTGEVAWTFPWPSNSNMDAAASQPQGIGDNRVFLAKGYDLGCAVIQVTDLGGEMHASEVWSNKKLMQTKFTNAVIIDGYAYGLSDGIFECIELESGQRKWKQGRYGHGQILATGDVILVQTEKLGDLVMLAIDSEKHRELGRFRSLGTESQAWNNLCLAGKRLLVRNADEAACWELP